MEKFIYYSLFFIIVLMLIENKKEKFTNNKDICRGKLTDHEYIDHMIPHHQVAIDISIMLRKKTRDPVMLEILRKLIWTQKTEITIMKIMRRKLPKNVSSGISKEYTATLGDYTKPNELGLTKTFCDPHFFEPENHMKHMKHMKLDDKMYIKHMIPHHMVAVDMSKVLLKNTKNDFMVYLAYRIIRSQQAEIVLLYDLLKKNEYKHCTYLL